MKFNMLLDFCIGKAAVSIKEFYILPVGDKLVKYDYISVNTIVKNKIGEVSSCDILYTDDLGKIQEKRFSLLFTCIFSVSPYTNGWSSCRQISEKFTR